MSSYLSPKIKRAKDKYNGEGLFAIKKINKGEIVVEFTNAPGQFINGREALKLYKQGNDYMFQVDEDLFFAATNKEELEDLDFLNHSCEPTCGIKETYKIVAMRDIKLGEEITFDYAMSESSSDFKMKCECGNQKCRKIITGNDWKIKELQKRYNGYFSEYLQRKIDNFEL